MNIVFEVIKNMNAIFQLLKNLSGYINWVRKEKTKDKQSENDLMIEREKR